MSSNLCPRCGSEIDAGEARGFCPSCLVKEAARPETEGDLLRAALEAKLHGHYRLIRLVGRGGMGAVYLARDLTLDREVAIKVVSSVSGDRRLYERLRREAKTAARLSHPNIVPLYAFGEVEGMPYFVMGYVRGESLAERLRRDGRVSEEDARRVLGEVADALDHAHRQGVVHRDVKPDNVLLDDETGRALLTDFGVATSVSGDETLTQHGGVIGTPHYMSPEQAEGRSDIDARSDIYSLGIMGYAMLAGRLPFDGSQADILRKQLTQQPAPLRALAPAVSDSTLQVVERCLEKDPGARFQDARSVRMSLGRTEESQLPFALQAVEGRGIAALLVVAAALGLALLVDHLTGASEHQDLQEIHFSLLWYAIAPSLLVCFFALTVVRLTREGFSLRQAQSVIWREPAWWPVWYPRALRRRGNVWDRLPLEVTLYRLWPVCLLAWSVVFPMAAQYVRRDFFFMHRNPVGVTISLVSLAAIIALWIVLWNRGARTLRKAGVGTADIPRVMFSVPPGRASYWSMPHIAPILARASRSEESVGNDSPHAHLQTILRHANELTGPLRPLGAQAAAAARQLVASIDQSDRQIASLARNLEPGEEERLYDKIEALAGATEYSSIRSLLERQLELVRQLSAGVEEARATRVRRVEMLHTLVMHMTSLSARVSEPAPEARIVSDEVLALCDEIGRQSEAAAGRDDAALTTVERTLKTMRQTR